MVRPVDTRRVRQFQDTFRWVKRVQQKTKKKKQNPKLQKIGKPKVNTYLPGFRIHKCMRVKKVKTGSLTP